MSLKNGYLALALISGFSLAACSNTAAGIEKDAERNADKAATAGGAVAAAIETIDVKSALMADRTVDASHINVDTFHETKTVVLKGSVKTATQRDEAARIAAAEAPGYRIDNQLTVVPNP